MSRLIAVACLFALTLAGCRSCGSSGDEAPSDPARVAALKRLADGRALVRITAMRELAPKASKYEVFAIAKAARNESEEVRIAAAECLAKATPNESVDLLGELLRDPLDAVRAATVTALASKDDDKARAYVVSAYEKGGPLTRAAVLEAGPEAFAKAIAKEAAARDARVDHVLHFEFKKELAQATKERRVAGVPRPDAQVIASALMELGRGGGPKAIEELVARVQDPSPLVAAGALTGLALAAATTQLAAIEAALSNPHPSVAEAAAYALADLAPNKASDVLVDAAARGDEALTLAALEAIGDAPLSDPQQSKLCEAGRRAQGASALALLRKAGCSATEQVSESPKVVGDQWLLLAALGQRSSGLLPKARTSLASLDGLEAAGAAAYLGVSGESGDAALLRDAAKGELSLVEQRRVLAAAAVEKEMTEAQREQAETLDTIDHLREVTGRGKAPPKSNPLNDLLRKRSFARDGDTFESRPGSLALIASASAGAARLGADVSELVDRLLASSQVRLNAVAVDVADLAGAGGEPLREKVRQQASVELKVRMALRDLEAGRQGAWERLLALGLEAPRDLRAEVARALAVKPVEARGVLVAYVEDGSEAAAPSLKALATLPDPELDDLLSRHALGRTIPLARAAVAGLTSRERGVAVLVRAAAHPDAALRAAALTALADRKACAVAPKLAPLAADPELRVRNAAAGLTKACTAGQ